MIVPCMVNSSLYTWSDRNVLVGLSSWIRISSAMIPASRKNTNDVIRYMCPMILWSVEESQPARTEPLRSVRAALATARRAAGSSRVVTGCSLKLCFWLACCWAIHVLNCAGVTILTVNSILLW